MNSIHSCYIHIPFCSSICSYCDFCKLLYNDKWVNEYLNSLEKEINFRYKNELIQTLYIGGGTPSCLSINQLEKLFNIIKRIDLSSDYEFTIEVNVNDITEEKLILFKKNKVNRISVGIETVNNKFMPFLNRFCNKNDVLRKIKLIRKYFDNFNIDLMYAFPNQTIDEVLSDLSFVVNLRPKHISIYSLIIEEHTRIFIDKVTPIDEDLESRMYYKIVEYLKSYGFNHYEISNFALNGYESKHNMVYWNNEKYYGFGLGASGYIDKCRYTNTKNISKYNECKYDYLSEKIDFKLDMEYEMILGLRKINGVSKKEFFNKFLSSIEDNFDIINLVKNKMLLDDGEYIYIPEDKLYISNSILVNFIGGSNSE